MPIQATTTAKRETLNLRIKPEDRSLIDRAAQARGKTRTDFVLDAARAAAEDAILDQTLIVNSALYDEFLSMLDAPPPAQASERMRKTLSTPTPWDKTA
jgi:uncharacterized protein (DUF1778 family)